MHPKVANTMANPVDPGHTVSSGFTLFTVKEQSDLGLHCSLVKEQSDLNLHCSL